MLTFDDLWNHQRHGVGQARTQNNLALFFDVGTGKTATLIYILREEYSRHGKILPTLIFAPLSVCPQWKKEFAKFSRIPQDKIHVLTASGAKRAREMEVILERDPNCIIVTNYESVQMKAFYALLLKWSPHITVFDESHRLKDSSSVRAKAIYPLAHAARRRFLLTGTPIPNGMLDIFGQYKALDPTIFGGNFFKFKKRYFYDKNANMPKHVHWPDWCPLPSSEKELGAVLGRTSVQAKKSECLDLPPLLKIPVSVQLSAEQAQAYETMRKSFVAAVGDKITVAEFVMTKTLRLQQILAGFIVPDEVDAAAAWVRENPRLDALEELLLQIGPQKTIIWTIFQPTYKVLGELCKSLKRKHVFLTGLETAKEKQESIEAFCRGDADTLISHPACGGVGLNLIEAKFSIYYTRGYSLEQFIQSEARNYRGGSEAHEKITHYHLIAEGTLDEVIATALLNKQNVADSVLAWAKNSVDSENG